MKGVLSIYFLSQILRGYHGDGSDITTFIMLIVAFAVVAVILCKIVIALGGGPKKDPAAEAEARRTLRRFERGRGR